MRQIETSGWPERGPPLASIFIARKQFGPLPCLPNPMVTKAAVAAFFFARSFPYESHLEYLEPPEDIGRWAADCNRHHRRRLLAAGHHPGRGGQRHRRPAAPLPGRRP